MSYTYVNCHKVSWHINCTHRKTHELPEDGQGLGSKHALALINKTLCNKLAWRIVYVM